MGCNGSKTAAGAAPAEKVQPLEGDFKLTLERSSDEQTLGLRIIEAEQGSFRVEGVKEEGLVPDFIKANANTPDQHMKEGDLIIAVNGVSGSTEALKAELKQKTIILTVKRAEKAPAAAPAEEKAAEKAETPAVAAEPAAEPEGSPTAEQKAEGEAAPAAAADAPPTEASPAPAADAPAAEEAAPVEPNPAEVPVIEAPAAGAAASSPEDPPAPDSETVPIDVAVVNEPQETVEDEAKAERLCKLSMC